MIWLAFITASLGFIVLAIWLNYTRTEPPQGELEPNCLLTRHPLVFVSGPKSLFYFRRYWNWIPQCLRDHGYEVIELNLHGQDVELRKDQWRRFITSCRRHGLKIHAFGDRTVEHEFEWLDTIDPEHDVFRSLNILTRNSPYRLSPTGRIRYLDMEELPVPKIWRATETLHRLSNPLARNFDVVPVGLSDRLSQANSQRFFLKTAISLAEDDLSVVR